MTENEAKEMLEAYMECDRRKTEVVYEKRCHEDCDNCELYYAQGTVREHKEAVNMAINALEKQIPKKSDKTEITLSKRKFATELKQLVHQKCVEINHYVSGCNSPFSYLQIADVQESLREIENTLNIKIKE